MTTDTDSRLDKLEIDLAHANHTIDELNAIVIDQGRQIDRLTRKLMQMTDRVEELLETSAPGHQVEKPPHY